MAVGFQNFFFSSNPIALQKSLVENLSNRTGDLSTIHVLVPNYYVGAQLRHMLAQKRAVLNVRFITFRDLAKFSLRTNDAFLTKTQLTPDMELYLIGHYAKKALARTERGIISGKRGFHQNLRKLFHHMIMNGAQKIPHINDKTRQFDQIFQKYLDLKNKYYQDVWLIEAAADHPADGISTLWIHGFTQFSPIEMKWINRLAQQASIDLWMERPFFEDLQEAIFTWAGENFENAEELDITSNTTVLVQPASHIQEESLSIAQTIVQLQKNKPVPFHKIGVFLNDYQKQRSYIEQTFNKYGIPHVVYGGQPLTSTQLGKSLECLAEVLFQNWKRDTWIRFLQTFPFKPEVYEANGTRDDWNQWTVEAQIADKNAFFLQRLEQLYKKLNNPKLKNFIEWQRVFVPGLEQVEKMYSKNIPGFFQALFEWVQIQADTTQILDEHGSLFDNLIYFSKILDTETSWQEIKPIVIEKIRQSSIQDKVFESDGVFIAPMSLLPGLTFEVLFMPFMNEGAFPKSAPQSFDLTSQEMFKITQKSGVTFASSEQDFEMQKVLFETTKSRTHQLLVSYSDYALPNQSELRPSVFLHGLPKTKPFKNEFEIASKVQTNENFTKNIRQYNDAQLAKSWSHYNALISSPSEKKIYSARDLTNYLSCPRKYYLSQVLRLSVAEYPEDRFEVDRMDKGTLVHDMLFTIFSRLKSENLFPLDVKNEEKIMHVAKSVATERLDKFVLSHAYGSEEMWKIDRDELLNDITQYMKFEIKEGKYWTPYALEYRFGMKSYGGDEDPLSTDNPVSLPVLNKQLSFRGKVDRIDLSPDKQQMRIVDYKTGAFKHVNWNYEKGTNLQIPLYMLLSKHFFKDIQPERTEGALVHVKSFSNFDKRTLPHESLSQVEEKIIELLELADTGINEGKFYPNPGNNRSNCRLCDFQSFCGENIDRDIESIPVDEFMSQYQGRKDAIK